MYLFELWREFKLSLAEIFSFFSKNPIIYVNDRVLVLDKISEKEVLNFAKNAGWTIKISSIEKKFYKSENSDEILDFINEEIDSIWTWKIDYGVNLYWEKSFDQKRLLMDAKRKLKWNWLSTRFVNQDFKNLSSAIINGEKLVQRGTDFNVVTTTKEVFLWKTIWVQNISEYSKRDYWKKRDMETGMLPPKLAQMMINIAVWDKKPTYIYDPFCGLWTILIESVIAWNVRVFWSDINEEMVTSTKENLEFIKKEFSLHDFKSNISLLDARNIAQSEAVKFWKIDAIVSEWYLWNIFTHSSITLKQIDAERKNLLDIYDWFFSWLKKARFSWKIVISFPFWNIKWNYVYFDEIYALLKKYCIIEKLLPENPLFKESKMGSLLYKRDKQIVGREIFKLRVK